MRTALNALLLLLFASGVRAGEKAAAAPGAHAATGPARAQTTLAAPGQLRSLLTAQAGASLTPQQLAAVVLTAPGALAQPGAQVSLDAAAGTVEIRSTSGEAQTIDLKAATSEGHTDAALVRELARAIAEAGSEGEIERLLSQAYERKAAGTGVEAGAARVAAAPARRSLLSRFVARGKAGAGQAIPPAPASKILSEDQAQKWMLGAALLNMIGLEGIMESAPYYFKEVFLVAGLNFVNVLVPIVTLVAFLGAGYLSRSPMKLYIGANVVRLLTAVALIAFLASLGGVAPAALAGLNPLWIAGVLYALNLGMWRLAMPAETPILTGMIKDPARLEGYGALSQGLMQVVGLALAYLIGKLAPVFGYFPAMALQAVAAVGILAIMVFKIRPSLLASQAALAAAAPAAGASKAAAEGPGLLKSLFSNPLLGWSFLAALIMLLPFNPLLNQVIAPSFGAYVASVAGGTDIQFGTQLVSVFFAGNLLGFLVNWRESKLIQKFVKPASDRQAEARRAGWRGAWDWGVAKLDSLVLGSYLGKLIERHSTGGRLTDEGRDTLLSDSLLMWLKLAPLALAAFAALVFPTPYLAYGSMLLFGSVGIILINKLRWFSIKQLPSAQQGSFMALLIGGWTAVSIGLTYGLGQLFEAFPNGAQPFMVLGAVATALGLALFWIRGRLASGLGK